MLTHESTGSICGVVAVRRTELRSQTTGLPGAQDANAVEGLEMTVIETVHLLSLAEIKKTRRKK
jgi:hypothetical protein